MKMQSSKRGEPRYFYQRAGVPTRIWLLLTASLFFTGEVESPSGIPIAPDACRVACESTYDPDLDIWPNLMTVWMWERCEVYGMCSLACWSLMALESPGAAVAECDGTKDTDLHESRRQCIRCCETEVRLLLTHSCITPQFLKKFIDFHQIHNLPIPSWFWSIPANVCMLPYP